VTDSPNPADPRVGTVLQDRYRILAAVATGGMGAVYRGERLQLGRAVAIKFLHPWIASQPAFIQRFEVEARAMSRLAHPNCVSVIDFGVADVPFIVMDFVAGRSLRHLLENERLEPSRAVAITRQILAGLAHAHAQGIIHRDLKPENIVVSDSPGLVDHVRILDFGLAKLHDGPALTVGVAVGTPSYMAPEQSLAEGVIDVRTDIYAIGLLLFEMLTGKKPFVSDKVAEVFLMHQRQAPPSMNSLVEGGRISDALEAVVAKALAKSSNDRFASAEAMAEALEKIPENAGARPVPAAIEVPLPDQATLDKLATDKTIVDTHRHPELPAPGLSPEPRPSAAAKPMNRRRFLTTLAAVTAVVLVVTTWALLHGRAKNRIAALPPPAPSTAAAPLPPMPDDLLPMTPDSTPGLVEAVQLIRLGLRDQAITVLVDVRRNYPGSAYANFLLAVTHFEKMWWTVGLQHAQAAIQLDPAYRRSPRLAKLVVRSLMSDSFWERAAAFLDQELADVSGPYLAEAAQLDKSPRVRMRAAQLLARRESAEPRPR
jgi:eukaryotic-like serine/threonine-protein kinase